MYKVLLIVLILVSGCASLTEAPTIAIPSDVTIDGWRFDKEYFTNDMECHGIFMATEEDVEAYFGSAASVSEESWNENTRQYACNVKGTISTSEGTCAFFIWEGGKAILNCPQSLEIYLVSAAYNK